jgi:hypothetical protein
MRQSHVRTLAYMPQDTCLFHLTALRRCYKAKGRLAAPLDAYFFGQ